MENKRYATPHVQCLLDSNVTMYNLIYNQKYVNVENTYYGNYTTKQGEV